MDNPFILHIDKKILYFNFIYMSFQRNVLTVAIVLFVLLLLLIAVMMNNAKNNQAYPPELSACPDYWKVLVDDGKCQNVNALGNGNS